MTELERMIIQCKLNGADYVKVQLYNSLKLFNNEDRKFLEFSRDEFLRISDYSKKIGIKLFVFIFDEEKLIGVREGRFIQIASRTVVDDIKLCEKILNLDKKVIISLGMYDFKKMYYHFQVRILYIYIVFLNIQLHSQKLICLI